ncbi:MAG: hypothetical protein Q9225_001689 [Loekoesia sp. 1 TL-2023]
MPPSRTDKKRHVSRPLSPPYKRRKSAPSSHDQDYIDAQAAEQSSARQSSRRKSAADRVPHPLQLASMEDAHRSSCNNASQLLSQSDVPSSGCPGVENPFFLQNVPRAQGLRNISPSSQQLLTAKGDDSGYLQGLSEFSLLTQEFPIRGRPLPVAIDPTEVDASKESPYQTMSPPSYGSSESEHSANRQTALNKARRKDWRREQRVAHKKAIKDGKRPATEIDSNDASSDRLVTTVDESPTYLQPSPGSSSSSGLTGSLSPLDLGSPLSDQTSLSNLRSAGVVEEDTNAGRARDPGQNSDSNIIRERSIDHVGTWRRIFSSGRVSSGSSIQEERVERSNCPSPSPLIQLEDGVPGAYLNSVKSMHSAPNFASTRGRELEPISAERAFHDRERDESPWSKDRPNWRDSKRVLANVILGEPDQVHDEHSPMDSDADKKMSSASMEACVSSLKTFNGQSTLSHAGSGSDHVCEAKVRTISTYDDNPVGGEKTVNPLWNYGSNAYPPIEAQEPMMVFPVLTGDGTMRDMEAGGAVDRDISEHNGPDALLQQRAMPQASHVQQRAEEDVSLERFPSIAEEDLRYTSAANSTSNEAILRPSPRQETYQPSTSPRGGHIEIPRTPLNSIAPTRSGNWQDMRSTGGATSQPIGHGPGPSAHLPEPNSGASSVGPSLRADVYHDQTHVTSRTPEPTLDPREEEPGPTNARQVGGTHRIKDPSPLGQKQGEKSHQPTDSNLDLSVAPGQPSGKSSSPATIAAAPADDHVVEKTGNRDQRNLAPNTSDDASGRPIQDAATSSTLLPTPGLTVDERNEPVVQQHLGEEARERQTTRQSAEQQQSESIEEWIAASTPRRRCGRMTLRQRRPQVGISSDEATCCFYNCLVSLRPLCCGRKPDRDRPVSVRQRQRQRQRQPDASTTPLTEGQLDEHRRRTGEPHVWGRGSTQAVGESSPHQRERNDQSQREPAEHQDGANTSTTPVENSAPVQGAEDTTGLQHAAADNESVTAPLHLSQTEPTRSKYTQPLATPQLRSSGSS